VVGLHRPVLGSDGRALDQRQQVALHALARDVRADRLLATCHLVDLVDEDDAVLLGVGERLDLELVLVDELAGLLVGEELQGLAHLHLAGAGAVAAEVLEHRLQLLLHLFHSRRRHDLDAGRQATQLDLDLAIVELLLPQHLAELLAGLPVRRLRRRIGGEAQHARPRQQRIEHALLGGIERPLAHFRHLALARHFHGDVRQLLDDRVDVTADVADLGELGGLDLDERRVGELRQAARDLGLADPGRADHEDVLRGDLLAQRLAHLHAPPAVAQRNRHGALGCLLPDDVLVELLDDLSRSECG